MDHDTWHNQCWRPARSSRRESPWGKLGGTRGTSDWHSWPMRDGHYGAWQIRGQSSPVYLHLTPVGVNHGRPQPLAGQGRLPDWGELRVRSPARHVVLLYLHHHIELGAGWNWNLIREIVKLAYSWYSKKKDSPRLLQSHSSCKCISWASASYPTRVGWTFNNHQMHIMPLLFNPPVDTLSIFD